MNSSGQVAQLVEQGTENPRVGGSIPSLATLLLLALCSGCAPDACEALCDQMRTDLATCMTDWPVGWEEMDASGPQDFKTQCRNRWAVVRSELEPRELQDALDQCSETETQLQSLTADTGGVGCDTLRALYIY